MTRYMHSVVGYNETLVAFVGRVAPKKCTWSRVWSDLALIVQSKMRETLIVEYSQVKVIKLLSKLALKGRFVA